MPAEYPDFPSRQQVLAYFLDYADRFALNEHVRLRCRVDHIELSNTGRWMVTSTAPSGTRKEEFSHLIIATGHHWAPNTPRYPGRFDGQSMHSHDFKTAASFAGQRVLVVGGGNSGCDIAVEVSRMAERTALSMRRGCFIVPKVLFGSPVDVQLRRLRHLPKWLRDRVAEAAVRLSVGRYAKYGLPEPQRRLMQMHPTLNTRVLDSLRHGDIEPRPEISRLEGRVVRFNDGKKCEFDTIIWATGYKAELPDLGIPDLRLADRETPPLYLKMMPEKPDNLYFVGLFQPIGCIWTLADKQARIAALQITGRLRRPRDLGAQIRREMKRREFFDRHPRHALEVDGLEFAGELAGVLRMASA